MAAFNKFNKFVADLANGVHDFSSDVLKVALTNAANPPVLATDGNITDLSPEIDYTLLGGVNPVITTISSTQTGGTYTLTLQDLVITSTGAAPAFQHITVFNSSSTPANQLICSFNYGSDLSLASGESLTVDFASDGGPNGVLFQIPAA